MSYIDSWKKKRIEYWQPVIYFSKNNTRLDFNICAKNACTSIKAYYTWVKDPNANSLYPIDHPRVIRSIKSGELKEDDLDHLSEFAYLNHTGCRRSGRVSQWLNHEDTTFKDFFRKDSIRVAVKRDPIKRFISGYLQIYQDTAFGPFRQHNYHIDQLLDLLESKEYWNEHLETQSWWMGTPDRFDKIFDIKDTYKCIEFMNDKLGLKTNPPDFHRMKTSMNKPDLDRKQIDRIEQLYLIDYENGWY
jgi:hypothetical protein